MTHEQKMQEFLKAQLVEIGVSEFVSITSNIYHAFEAEHYDRRHESIDQSRKYWSTVTTHLSELLMDEKSLNILDFGCGTGFASEQLVQSTLGSKIRKVFCYDLSPDMIARCQQKFASDGRFEFFANKAGLSDLKPMVSTFDIIVCNALIHHILEPGEIFRLLDRFLKPNGFLVLGHEPNKSYYKNQVLQKSATLFRLHKKVKDKLFKRSQPDVAHIPLLTKQELVARGIVRQSFPYHIIPKFVDIHVPMGNNKDQPWGEMGFDEDYVNEFLGGRYSTIKRISYNHIKDQKVAASPFWTTVSRLFSKLYPADGADTIFLFKKNC